MSKRSGQRQRQERRERERAAAFERQAAVSAPGAPTNAQSGTAEAALEAVERTVQRVAGDQSQQPRFNGANAPTVFGSTWNWVKIAALHEEPDARIATVRQWDNWLREFVLKEPYLAGVYNSVVQIDKNRGWSLIGGRNQVLRYSDILHAADDDAGWRNHITWQAQSYYSTRAGFVAEIGSEGEGGPLRALWSVDPARIELTGDLTFPLKYFPAGGSQQDWQASDFIRAASLISTDETRRGYGFPANARNFDLAKIMVAVWEHDKEQLAARAPRGLLLLKGISEDQWDQAMQAREERLDSLQRQYYGSVATLAASGAEEIDAKLFALSQLPKDFNLREWVSLLMYGYALSYGYDAREFFPVDSGQLGSAKETEVQHRKASSKGDLDFSLAYQEQLQSRLPETLQFEFEQRDASGEHLDAVLALSKAAVITEANKWIINGQNVLSAEQILQMAAQAGVIPEEWTVLEEDVTATDTEEAQLRHLRQRAMELPRVQRALERFPAEPIVIYRSKTGRMKTIFPPEEQRQQRFFQIERASVQSIASRFRSDLRALIRGYCSAGNETLQSDIESAVERAMLSAYFAGLTEGGIPKDEISGEDVNRAKELVAEQLGFAPGFVQAVQDGCDDKDALYARADLWVQSVAAAGTLGLNAAKANEMVEFGGEDGEEICNTCRTLKGMRHRRKWFTAKGLVPGQPGNKNFECGGYKCQHKLIPV